MGSNSLAVLPIAPRNPPPAPPGLDLFNSCVSCFIAEVTFLVAFFSSFLAFALSLIAILSFFKAAARPSASLSVSASVLPNLLALAAASSTEKPISVNVLSTSCTFVKKSSIPVKSILPDFIGPPSRNL